MKKDRNQRIEIVNSLLSYLADHEKDFFRYEDENRTAHFKHDGRNLWFVDHYSNVSMRMTIQTVEMDMAVCTVLIGVGQRKK